MLTESYSLFLTDFVLRINLTGSMSDGVFTGNRFSYSGTALSLALENPFLGLGLAGSSPVSANIMDIFNTAWVFGGTYYFLPLLYLIFVSINRFSLNFGPALTILMLYIQRPSVGQFITTVIVFILIYQINKSFNIYFRCRKYGGSLSLSSVDIIVVCQKITCPLKITLDSILGQSFSCFKVHIQGWDVRRRFS